MRVNSRSDLRHFSRRAFLSSCPMLAASALAQTGAVSRPVPYEYRDPSTDFKVTRLTSPAHHSRLPAHYCRFISRKSSFVVFLAGQPGSWQLCRLDMKNGRIRQLTQGAAIDPQDATLFPNDEDAAFFDGDTLYSADVRSGRQSLLCSITDGWRRGRGLSVSSEGRMVCFVELRGGQSRIRLLDSRSKKTRTIASFDGEASEPLLQPGGNAVLFRDGGGALWTVQTDGKKKRELAVASGTIGPACWSSNGRAVQYLNYPADRGQLHTLREYFVTTRQDRLIAKTTQFIRFAPNRDGSVFVGASGSLATPFVLLLLRKGARELTICEHRASGPGEVSVAFAPNSRWILFQSDRDGVGALYTVGLSGLIEETGP